MAEDKTFTKEDLDAAVEKAVGPLKSKLDEVMDEAKEAKRKLRAASEIKPEDLTAAEERADRAEAALKDAQKAAKDATTAKEKAEEALKTEQGFTQKLLIQDGLKSALIANGVKDEDFIDSLAAKFGSSATVKVDGETRTALIGDKPLPDAIKEWAATDAGKKFIAAPANGGGGAQGSRDTNKPNAQTITRSQFNALPQYEQGEAGQKMAKGELKVVEDAA